MQELKIKTKLHKKSKELQFNLKKLDTLIPKVETPEIIKHKFDKYETNQISLKEKIKQSKEHNEDISIEDEIREIQEKLRRLQY